MHKVSDPARSVFGIDPRDGKKRGKARGATGVGMDFQGGMELVGLAKLGNGMEKLREGDGWMT